MAKAKSQARLSPRARFVEAGEVRDLREMEGYKRACLQA